MLQIGQAITRDPSSVQRHLAEGAEPGSRVDPASRHHAPSTVASMPRRSEIAAVNSSR